MIEKVVSGLFSKIGRASARGRFMVAKGLSVVSKDASVSEHLADAMVSNKVLSNKIGEIGRKAQDTTETISPLLSTMSNAPFVNNLGYICLESMPQLLEGVHVGTAAYHDGYQSFLRAAKIKESKALNTIA